MSDIGGHGSRRGFLQGVAASGAALALRRFARADAAEDKKVAATQRKIPLGFDNFSIRDLGWKAPRLIEYAHELGLDSVLLSDLHVYESLEEPYLRDVAAKARELRIVVHAGTGGICPTSARVQKDFGSPEEHLRLLIRVARTLGSPVARCYLGSMEDRQGEGGIERHIQSTVDVLRRAEKEARDAGVKIAVENHAGDMQAHELVRLIEQAGKAHVGATVDSGNATWALEDPVRNLEILGPYAVSSGIRDSMVWENDKGAVVQWTAMGEGCVDLVAYADTFEKLCPGVPMQLEIISGFSRPFPYYERDFWGPYAGARASDFAAYVALARRGKEIPPFSAPAGADRRQATRDYQKSELERSVRHCREALGIRV